jgi:hypothetical protein
MASFNASFPAMDVRPLLPTFLRVEEEGKAPPTRQHHLSSHRLSYQLKILSWIGFVFSVFNN